MTNLGETFKNAFGIVQLKDDVISKVAKDEGATGMTLLLVALVTLVTSIISVVLSTLISGFFGGAEQAAMQGAMGIFQIILEPVFAIISLFIGVGIFFLSCIVLGGKGKYMEMLRPMGHITILSLISWVPLVNLFVAIWQIVVTVKVFKVVHSFSTGKAIVAWLIPVIVMLILFGILFALVGAAIFSSIIATRGMDTLNGLVTLPV